MLKIISNISIIPPSLIVTGVTMPAGRDYIGSGGFGRVFKGELRGAVVALKVLYRSENQVAFCREALMWRSLKHKFVLPFLGIHEIKGGTEPQLFLVSPYMKNGTLSRWRKQVNPSIAEIEDRLLEVARGLEYIHSEGVVHGDLRGENVLLNNKFHVQIADFGLTRLSEATNTRSGALHLNFAAPELLEYLDDASAGRTQMSDVYAFGCLCYEIYYARMPFADKQGLQIIVALLRGQRPQRRDSPTLSNKTWALIQQCWVKKPSKRPRMKNVMERLMAVSSRASSVVDVPEPSMVPPSAPVLYFGHDPVIFSDTPAECFIRTISIQNTSPHQMPQEIPTSTSESNTSMPCQLHESIPFDTLQPSQTYDVRIFSFT
ncbi:kinase-like domain-containing protein [Amanita rubescens]|nr:kinase-like domain-containing protein [Amanita rubescens]